MRTDLSPLVVARRLARLRELSTPMSALEAHARMMAPPCEEPFERAVARRLAELRALSELTASLHRRA